jgi:hypothetical protein
MWCGGNENDGNEEEEEEEDGGGGVGRGMMLAVIRRHAQQYENVAFDIDIEPDILENVGWMQVGLSDGEAYLHLQLDHHHAPPPTIIKTMNQNNIV